MLSGVVSQYFDMLLASRMEFPLMTPFDVKLDFHPVARWVVHGNVVEAAHGPAELTNSGVVPSSLQLTYGVR